MYRDIFNHDFFAEKERRKNSAVVDEGMDVIGR
jgi:hypothetical protein